MRAALLFLAAFVAIGCAGSRIKPVEAVGGEDPSALSAALAAYNEAGENRRVIGEVRARRAPPVAFGARSVIGRGVRMDGVALPAMKLLFSAACPPDDGCEVYFPDDFVVYREEASGFGRWLSMLVAGKVPLFGVPLGAGRDPRGAPVLKLGDAHGQWMEVVFTPDGRLPVRAVYGERGGPPLLELVFSEYGEDGGGMLPGEVLVGGAGSGDEFAISFERIEETGALPREAFILKTPDGVRRIDMVGRDTWKRLGMFWIPKF